MELIRFVAYVWLGLVLGVSFLATPIKFRAPSLTMPVALDVGRTTFHAFGKVEWGLVAALSIAIVRARSGLEAIDWTLLAVIVAIVVAQTSWLIPRLDIRVAAVISGEPLPPSRLHALYAGVEALKALALLLVGAWTASQA